MNQINADRDRIVQCIGKDGFGYIFPKINEKCISYFEAYDMENESNIDEFDFSNIPELQQLFGRKRTMKSSAIDMACCISAFKSKPRVREESEEYIDDEYEIPTFIYEL